MLLVYESRLQLSVLVPYTVLGKLLSETLRPCPLTQLEEQPPYLTPMLDRLLKCRKTSPLPGLVGVNGESEADTPKSMALLNGKDILANLQLGEEVLLDEL